MKTPQGNGIYVLQDNGELATLRERPYDSEDLLQRLLADYPSILAGDQINPSAPRNWLLVRREAGVPCEEGGTNRWSLDHLFLDQDAVPTLVEVKRSTDTRVRREVVGQMLDYAANAVVYWSIESIQANFEHTCAVAGRPAQNVLMEFLGETGSPDGFWNQVKTNIQAGKLRLLFVADEIPNELRRIIEFLNSQMDPVEVLAVEIKQFVGGSLRTLVPRVIGQTAEAERRKGSAKLGRQWDEDAFFCELAQKQATEEVEVARKLLDWGYENTTRIAWGRGNQHGSMAPLLEHGGTWHVPFAVWTYGLVELQFQHQAKKPPFDTPEQRFELLRRLNELPGVVLPADSVDRRPTIPLSKLVSQDVMRRFLSIMEWCLDEVRRTPISPG